MPISISIKDPDQVLAAFDIKEALINKLGAKNISVQITSTGISFVEMGSPAETVVVKQGALSMALKGKLGPASKAAIKHKIMQVILKLVNEPGDENPVLDISDEQIDAEIASVTKPKPKAATPAPKKAGIVTPVKKVPTSPSKPAPVKAIPKPTTDLDALLGEAPVPLKDAKKLYQPVKGTSGGAKYFTVAIMSHFNVAARYKGKTLSMRAEGNIEDYKQNLEKAGFAMSNFSKGYVSVHMDIPDDTLASKTLGAILGGMNLDTLTPVPNLLAIQGKGA